MEQTKDPIWDNLKAAIKLAKRQGSLKFKVESPETISAETNEENGFSSLAREGYSSEDITGYFAPDSFREYFKTNFYNFKQAALEFGLFSSFNYLSMALPWSSWLWCLESTEHVASDVVKEQYASKNNKEKALQRKNHASLVLKVTDEEIFNYLNKHCKKINDNMWVNNNDYSVIYYNYKNKPYALKDGWSLKQVEEIMQEWMNEVIKEKIKVKAVK